ncbi:GapS4a family protein [Teredinibacter turnerae]|uniref:GapS4a family protein n=1 Tax=Teredinibacter turnerae TaxID=2426 RepID=UPI0030D0B0D3
MGELSKFVGEYGEKVSEKLLEHIGWKSPESGIDIPCLNSEKHKLSENSSRREHGLDFLYYYKSELVDKTLQFCCVSAKFNKDGYPVQSKIKNKFKEYVRDLDTLLECFYHSEKCAQIKKGQRGISRTQYAGILLWLHGNVASDVKQQLLGDVSDSQFPAETELNHPVYLIDNAQAAFLFESITHVRNKHRDGTISFFYHQTGNNFNDINRVSSGDQLPLELVNSDIFVLKADYPGEKKVTFIVLANIPFDSDCLRRLMGLCHNITSNLSSTVEIYFPNYHELNHINDVKNAKLSFEDKAFADRVTVFSYNDSHVSL